MILQCDNRNNTSHQKTSVTHFYLKQIHILPLLFKMCMKWSHFQVSKTHSFSKIPHTMINVFYLWMYIYDFGLSSLIIFHGHEGGVDFYGIIQQNDWDYLWIYTTQLITINTIIWSEVSAFYLCIVLKRKWAFRVARQLQNAPTSASIQTNNLFIIHKKNESIKTERRILFVLSVQKCNNKKAHSNFQGQWP